MGTMRWVGLLVLGLSGCGRVETHHVTTGVTKAPRTGDVKIVMEGSPAPDGFEEVAIVQAVGRGNKAQLEPLVSSLKTQALQLGCNAVIRIRVDQGSQHATAVGVAGVLP